MKNSNIQNQAGVSLIEILITLLVMSVGALGVASMQLTGLKYTAGAQTRSQASLLANDMMDRILGFQSAGRAPSKNCYTAVCNTQELVAHDKFVWLQQVSDLLPFGEGEITHSNIDSDQRIYVISLRWRRVANTQGGDDSEEFQLFTYRGGI